MTSEANRIRVTYTAVQPHKVESFEALQPGDTVSIYDKDGRQKRQGIVASVGADGKGVLTLAGEVLLEAGDILVLEPRGKA